MPLVISAILTLLLSGCVSIPPMESSRLIERMTNVYGSCQTFEDSGVIKEVEVESGETNVSHVKYSIQFVRGRAFRMELHSNRKHDAGSYSLVYHKTGGSWSVYDSLNSQLGGRVVRTNISQDSVIGQGVALSYGLFPDIPRLLHLDTNSLSGFRLFDRASVSREHLDGVLIYRLKLEWDRDVDEYWIHPRTFAILKQQDHEVRKRGDRTAITTRETFHSPKMNALSETVIEFKPPSSQAAGEPGR